MDVQRVGKCLPEEMIFELISEGQEECQMREREELDFKDGDKEKASWQKTTRS